MLSDSISKSVPCWLEYLLRLEVTWLILVIVSSCVRTQERNDIRVLEVAPNCVTRCGQIANALFCLAGTVFKGCFKTSHPKAECFHLSYLHPTPGYLIAEVLLWGDASSHDYRWLGLEQSVLSSSPCSISSHEADRSAVILTCAVADMVVPRSVDFYFLISSIMFLFLSSLVSRFWQEEWLPRGLCSVTGGCMMCVVRGRAVHTEMGTVGCSAETPYPEERWPCIFMGMEGEEQTTGVLCWFQLLYCGSCSWIEPFESCVVWEKH